MGIDHPPTTFYQLRIESPDVAAHSSPWELPGGFGALSQITRDLYSIPGSKQRKIYVWNNSNETPSLGTIVAIYFIIQLSSAEVSLWLLHGWLQILFYPHLGSAWFWLVISHCFFIVWLVTSQYIPITSPLWYVIYIYIPIKSPPNITHLHFTTLFAPFVSIYHRKSLCLLITPPWISYKVVPNLVC